MLVSILGPEAHWQSLAPPVVAIPVAPFVSHKKDNLQGVGQELVHLRDLGRDREVDGSVSDLNNQAANDVGVDLVVSAYDRFPAGLVLSPYLVGDLELLALADVGGLGHSGLKSVQGPVVQGLYAQHCVSIMSTSHTFYSSACVAPSLVVPRSTCTLQPSLPLLTR